MRILIRVFAALLLVVAAVYGCDYAAWRVRSANGRGTDSILVSRVTVATLKGNKEEYDFDGSDVLPCTRSLFRLPVSAGWSTPCWWLRDHRQVVTRY